MHVTYFCKIAILGTALLGILTPAHADLVFAAPPRETGAQGSVAYEPIADFLTKLTGQKVVYTHADNWLSYQSGMRKGAYDIVFDGPQFIAWRMVHLQHVPLVKLPGQLGFVVIVKKGEQRIKTMGDLAGRTLCGFAPPNLATLTAQYEFPNPSRQPLIIETKSFKDAYNGVLAGKCNAAVIQAKLFASLDAEAQAARVIFTSKPLPNQAFSVGPKITTEMRAKIVQGLKSPAGMQATQALLEQFKASEWMPATPEEYQGLDVLLRDVWGFGPTT